MDRNKGILWVIGCILVIGILITSFTSSLVKRQEESLAAQSERYESSQDEEQPVMVEASGLDVRLYEAAGYGEESTQASGEEKENAKESVGTASRMEESEPEYIPSGNVAGDKQTEDEETGIATAQMAAGSQPVGEGKSRMAPTAQAAENSEADSASESAASEGSSEAGTENSRTAQEYKKHFAEIDSQMEALRNQAVSTYDMKTTLENEWKLWDSELNNIYGIIKGNLPEDQVEALVKDERAWIASRDAKAAESAGKYEGGTMESVEYLASMANSTRERVYYLVEQYENYLQ